jgi:outer membrane lipoprotein carrier protein
MKHFIDRAFRADRTDRRAGWSLFFSIVAAVLLLSLSLPVLSVAGSNAGAGGMNRELEAVVSRLEARYDKLGSISANFTQKVLSVGMGNAMTTGGQVWFKKPGMMRWQYRVGSTDELIGSGESLWLYQPELNQVIVSSTARVSAIATDFLTGVGSLRDDFHISLASKSKTAYVLTLTPKEETTGIVRLALTVDRAELLVRRTEIEDAFGTRTTVTFTEITPDALKPDSFFTFVPSEGLNVITQ